MAGVLRTPRPVPMLNSQAMKAAQVVATNDEVAAILKGLKLDKGFFAKGIRQESLQELAPTLPTSTSPMMVQQTFEGSGRRASMRRNKRRMTVLKGQLQDNSNQDFDIYLNEAVMPVLAQALDALCRQLARMKEQGDQLDPKVRARFNPLTWLGQQLLRRHPKVARTPRRQMLYRSFKDWADWEKGRRELLRRKDLINEVFAGFMLRGGVKRETLPDVVASIDDTLHLEGVLKSNTDVREALQIVQQPRTARSRAATVPARLIFEGVSWTFEEFWYNFGNAVMKHDIVPYSLILRGTERQRKREQEHAEYEKRQKAAEEERQQEEDEKRQLTGAYTSLYDQLSRNDQIIAILNGQKILSGDDVRPGDAGFDFEVPPHGPHVTLLSQFLLLLGFEAPTISETPHGDDKDKVGLIPAGLLRPSAKAKGVEGADEDEEYWDEHLANAWAVVQQVHHAETMDGVVDGEVLKQVLVPPVGFNMLRAKVEYELERRKEGGKSVDELGSALAMPSQKPSMEQLCQRLGMTMSRLEWLHTLFESFLQPDEPDPTGPIPCCLYPECPASIDKDQMRNLVAEVEPNLSKAQFEARFKRLDKDGSGLIEFDEFAFWVHSSDVRITSSTAIKMTFEEIAYRYQEPVELIRYLHSCFQDQLPEGTIDRYPMHPVGLAKQEAKFLAGVLTPGFDEEEFESSFQIVDANRNSGHCDFDEFLEILELDDLPAELRDKFEEN